MGLPIAVSSAMARLFFFVMLLTSIVACGAISSSAQFAKPKTKDADAPARLQSIARAQVWTPGDIRSMDIRTGPQGKGAFPFQETVTCDYVPKQLAGGSPKFACVAGGDELKVKFSAPVQLPAAHFDWDRMTFISSRSMSERTRVLIRVSGNRESATGRAVPAPPCSARAG